MTAGTLDGEAVEAIALLAARAEQAGQLDAEADDILPAGVTSPAGATTAPPCGCSSTRTGGTGRPSTAS
jgi:hypothetical protein